MAKKKTRRYYRRKPKKKRRAKKTFPLSIIIAGGTIPFVPARDGWASPAQEVARGNWTGLAQNLVEGFNPIISTKYGISRPRVELHFPRYLLILLGGVLAHKLASALGLNRYMAKMPSPLNKLSI